MSDLTEFEKGVLKALHRIALEQPSMTDIENELNGIKHAVLALAQAVDKLAECMPMIPFEVLTDIEKNLRNRRDRDMK